MKTKPSDLLTYVLVACAIVVAGLVARREFFSGPAAPAPEVRRVEGWQAIAATGSLLGPADAPLRIVEFSDFQCPFCATVRPELRKLQKEHPGKVAIVYRHLPLEKIHPHALLAANASECAGAQGRFEAYHDALFARQDSIGARDWRQYAEDARVSDLPEFERCVSERRYEARVADDMEEADRIGVRGTPTFIFDGKMVSGKDAPRQLSIWVSDALKDR